ncbi:hypothetical protein [Flavobacterium sp. KMS]|uniref:hypothetical protein n=1 Tax=Flavobacterium sp. KMS TaxID=1566023 RepID=UPI000B277C46|nr:hypothetical protein [Flavobacterium sp. KMS]
MMESKQVIVYDNQHGYSRFLKKEFGKRIDFEVYKKFNFISDFDNSKSDYSFIFFVIYSENDLLDFIKIHDQGLPIVVCSSKGVFDKFDNNCGINFIDISKPKKELVNDFQSFLYR